MDSQKEVVIKLAKLYSKLNQHLKAVCLLVDYYIRNEETADYDVANIICELLTTKQMHSECCYFVESLALDCDSLSDFLILNKAVLEQGLELRESREYKKQLERNLRRSQLEEIKENIPIDILISYAESLIKVGRIKHSMSIMAFLEELEKDEYYDILLDLIELYSEAKKYNDALRVCVKVIESENIEDKSLIMLKIGLLYGKMGMKSKEVESYNQALILNPSNDKVRFRLSELYENQGKIRQALEILGSGKEGDEAIEEEYIGDDQESEHKIDDNQAQDEIFSSDNEAQLGKRPLPAFELDNLDKPVSLLKTRSLELIKESPEERHQRILELKKLMDDIKYEESYNEKTKRRMENLIEQNHDFFLRQQKKIENILDKFNLDRLLLDFRRCEINMKSSDEDFFASSKSCILSSLKLEEAKKEISDSIYSKLLRESKGKILNSLKEDFPKDELNSLFIFKRKKSKIDDKFEVIFKDSKNKSRVAKRMSQKMMARMMTVSSSITLPKYIEILSKSLKVFYRKDQLGTLVELCDCLLSLRDTLSHDSNFTAEYLICGFLVNARLKSYEKSYVFFRIISKTLLDVSKNHKLKLSLISKIGDYTQSEITVLCFTTIYILFANFKNYNSKSRAFFQKFKDQFEHESMSKFANHLAAIIYIYSGSVEQSKACIEENYERGGDNVLYDMMLGFCYLMESTNRKNMNKLGSIEKAFDFFKKYEMNFDKDGEVGLGGIAGGAPEEAYYNIARAFSHINCPEMAIKMFQKVRRVTESKVIESNRAALERFKDEMGIEYVTKDMMTDQDLQEKKEREQELKTNGLYHNAAFNEMIWYKLTNNKEMEKLMIENYLTFDEI